MKKNNVVVTLCVLMVLLHHSAYCKKKDITSIAKKSQEAVNTLWPQFSEERRKRAFETLNVRFLSIDKKIKQPELNNSFNFNFFFSGALYLFLPTAYASFCLFTTYKIYTSLTKETGSMENFIGAIVESSAAWYGLKYFLPHSKKGYKKIKKCIFLKNQLNSKYTNTCIALTKINTAHETLQEARTKSNTNLEAAQNYLKSINKPNQS